MERQAVVLSFRMGVDDRRVVEGVGGVRMVTDWEYIGDMWMR